MKGTAYKGWLLCIFLNLFLIRGYAQVKVYPPYWWNNMNNRTLDLLVYNPEGFKDKPVVEGVEVLNSEIAPNTRYAYVRVQTPAQDSKSTFTIGKGKGKIVYELRERKAKRGRGMSPADVMYLITPDRFANGNPANDRKKDMAERDYSRDSIYGRHGGDIQGIRNHLGYIHDMGFNSLWICPLMTNDQPRASYHGYAITDHYNIDPRFGSNAEYAHLMEEMHQRKMKMVMDVVYNHFGSRHHLFMDPPDSTFFNFHNDYLQTNYRAATLFDPHAAESDRSRFTDGWFDGHMPDVNQRNPQMASFLIQNSIWWIEEFGIDAFRVDTYTYPDQQFMADLAKVVKEEYPDFFIFGETWVHFPEIQSYFVEGNRYNPIATYMDAVTDFQFCFAVHETFNQPQEWAKGLSKLYYRLAADYLYDHPENSVTFLDNHDLGRIYGTFGEDMDKLKASLGLLFTMRGIPCVYYGTEILMRETANHGVIRQDFPGGWPGDKTDKFTATGRTEAENEAHSYITKLLNWRKDSEAITQGKMKHFIPDNDIYVFFRYTESDTVMVVMNSNPNDSRTVKMERFTEMMPSRKGIDVLSGESVALKELTVKPKSIQIIQL
ncbi:MAG: alpha-amylase family glycosyl hydrolase [Owenweeksia sp.]